VHIHDGDVHQEAEFDHVLYCQRMGQENLSHWEESPPNPACRLAVYASR
jgi:hypothetical protein